VVGIFPNDAALLRLTGMLLIEQTTSGSSPAATYPRSPSRSSSSLHLPPRRSPAHPGLSSPTTILSYTTNYNLTEQRSLRSGTHALGMVYA
jgi:hypothetical protein